MSEQHKEQTDKMTKLEIELQGRVGVLENGDGLLLVVLLLSVDHTKNVSIIIKYLTIPVYWYNDVTHVH